MGGWVLVQLLNRSRVLVTGKKDAREHRKRSASPRKTGSLLLSLHIMKKTRTVDFARS